jgi:hypothetical protein
MADQKISQLNSLPASGLATDDLFVVVDISAGQTKNITAQALASGVFTLVPSGGLSSSQITFASGSISSDALAATGVTTGKIADDAITAAKFADNSAIVTSNSLPLTGSYTGQICIITTSGTAYYWDGSAWASYGGSAAVFAISGATDQPVNITATKSGSTVYLTTSLDTTSVGGQFLAGPTGSGGTAAYRTIEGTDIPTASSGVKGGVTVDGFGLTVSGTRLQIDNTISGNASPHLVIYSSRGLVTSGRTITAADLPIATSIAAGITRPGTGLEVDENGVVDHTNTATPGTYTKVTIDSEGHVTTGTQLADTDLPNHSAALLTTGTLDAARIAAKALAGTKLADYAITKIGESQPTADQIGQFFFNPLSRDLFLWDGNVFQPIGISVGEIVFAGTYDAGTNLVESVTSEGTAIGLAIGSPLPAASAANNRYYLVVSAAGTGTAPAPVEALSPPDIILSNGSNWTQVDVSQTITSQVATNVSFTPYGNIGATNVQAAVQEVDDEKLPYSGGTITGPLLIGSGGTFSFEGASDNAFETTLSVVDPTADRTVLIPNISGTLITTSDSATISGVMIASGTITNHNISPTAAIEGSKIQAATTTTSGVVVLTNSVSSTSTTTAATPSGVKTAYDLAAAALPASGGTLTGTVVFASGQTISGYAQLAAAQSFTAGQRGAVVTIAGSGTVTIDLALGNNFAATLSGNVTLATPTGMTAGQTGSITLTQDGTGSRLVSYSGWKFPGGSTPTATTTASGVDIIAYYVESATRISARMINDVK